jgi:hypothetical protein
VPQGVSAAKRLKTSRRPLPDTAITSHSPGTTLAGRSFQIRAGFFGRIKVARYEVPGNRERGVPFPEGRSKHQFVTSNARLPAQRRDRSSSGTELSQKTLTPHFAPGYFHSVLPLAPSPGTRFLPPPEPAA